MPACIVSCLEISCIGVIIVNSYVWYLMSTVNSDRVTSYAATAPFTYQPPLWGRPALNLDVARRTVLLSG